MKPRRLFLMPRTLSICVAPALVCSTVTAALVNTNENSSINIWTLPVGTNLLATAVPTPAAPAAGDIKEGASASWAVLTNNSVGDAPATPATSVTPANGTTLTYALNISTNTAGYNISSIDSYCAWGDSGRDNQNFTVQYSTVAAPTVFTNVIATVSNATSAPLVATHTRLTDSAGFLATGVHSIRFVFAGQENGYVGMRELIAIGSPVPLGAALTWTGSAGGNWNTTDTNWKTAAPAASAFTPNTALAFDSTGTNTAITVGAAATTGALAFTNSAAASYTFSGSPITSTADITSSGAGANTFGNSVTTTGNVVLSGTGSLTFNGALSAQNLSVTAAGTVNIAGSSAIGGVSLTAGAVNFTTSAPSIGRLSGTAGTVALGNATSPAATTLSISDAGATTYGGAITDASATAAGSLWRTGTGTTILTGTNTYTGSSNAKSGGGTLEFGKRVALYNAASASWTASNLNAESGSTLAFRVGSTGEFTATDFASIATGGFQSGSFLGIDTSADTTIAQPFSGSFGLAKTGASTLTLSGANTYTGFTKITSGALILSNAATQLTGNILVTGGSANLVLVTGAPNQLGPNTVLTMANGQTLQARWNLRGSNQVIAGIDSPSPCVSVIQNDETGQPGFTTNPGAVTLTINAAADHSWYGFIRDQNGGALSIVKNGAGTQEFTNAVGGTLGTGSFSYTGSTTINNGKLRLTEIANSSFGSDVTVNSPGIFELRSAGNFTFSHLISGTGGLLVTSATTNFTIVNNNANTFSGGTTVDNSRLSIVGSSSSTATSGTGTATGQSCALGAMSPSNVITIKSGGFLICDQYCALGQSTMVPAFAPSILVQQGGSVNGGTNTTAFLPNVTLDGGAISLSPGGTLGGFNTCYGLVGTLKVGGTSTTPSVITSTGAAGATNNATLGSVGLPGTTFQVADVTGSSAVDLTVSAVLRNVLGTASPLVKTGAGTMLLSGANTYTGDTTVSAGTLGVSGNSIVDTNKLVIKGGKVDVAAPANNETVGTLFLDDTPVAPGTYGSSSSSATHKYDTFFSGTGLVTVTNGPATTDPYLDYSLAIPNTANRGKTVDADGDGLANLVEFAFDTDPTATTTGPIVVAGGSITSHGVPSISVANIPPNGVDFRAVFGRRKNYLAAGLTYTVQFSADLTTWVDGTDTPTVIASDATIDAVSVPYPMFITTARGSEKPKFFRVKVSG